MDVTSDNPTNDATMSISSAQPELPVDIDCSEKLHLEDHADSVPPDVTTAGPSGEGIAMSQSSIATAEQSEKMVEVRKTSNMGCGLFATQDIPKGTRILSEEPIAQLLDLMYRTELIERFCAMALTLPSEKIVTLSRLYCNPQVLEKNDNAAILEWYKNNSVTDANGEELKGRKRQEHRKKMLKWFGIFLTNSSGHIMNNKEGRGLYANFSRINHSCLPNARYGWNETIQRFTVQVNRNIEKDEQILVSYLPLTYDVQVKRVKSLRESWGFDCTCEACLNPASDTVRVKMGIIRDLLASYENGDDRFPRLMGLPVVKSRTEALEMTKELAEHMISLGLVTMELVKL